MTAGNRAALATRGDGSTFVRVPLKWTPEVDRACRMVGKTGANPVQIAAECGVSPCVVRRWVHHPTFQDRAEGYRREYRNEVMASAVARVVCRVAAYQEEYDAIEEIERERAAAPEIKGIPGGRTGRIVLEQRQVGEGTEARTVAKAKVDVELMRKKLDVLKQATQDLGQWAC
jgi:hypothetical protein